MTPRKPRDSNAGISRSKDVIFVQLTLAASRTLEQKRGFYKRVVDDLHDRLGVRREDVFVCLVGTGREDWSFGNGEAALSSAVAEAPRIG